MDFIILVIYNCLYGHKYLDSRHLITIMFGSQDDPNYRKNLRDPLKNLLSDKSLSDGQKLQLFTRIKIAIYEGLKLDYDCRKKIEKYLDKLNIVTS